MWRIVVVVAVVVLSSSTAGADPDPTATRIAMQDYFAGEQTGGIILVGMGVGGLATGALLVRQSSPTLRGASYPLLGLGLAHLAAGIFIYISSAKRIEQFDAAITKDTAVFVRDEQPRMRGVSTQFLVLKIVEGVLGAGGIAMAAIGHTTNRPRLKGAGIALAIEMAATFAFDVFAARRAHTYRDELARLEGTQPVSLEVGDAPRMVFSTAIAF